MTTPEGLTDALMRTKAKIDTINALEERGLNSEVCGMMIDWPINEFFTMTDEQIAEMNMLYAEKSKKEDND